MAAEGRQKKKNQRISVFCEYFFARGAPVRVTSTANQYQTHRSVVTKPTEPKTTASNFSKPTEPIRKPTEPYENYENRLKFI